MLKGISIERQLMGNRYKIPKCFKTIMYPKIQLEVVNVWDKDVKFSEGLKNFQHQVFGGK